MPLMEYLQEDEPGTGVGADLFIRKKKPGPRIGVGYLADIFENGVKIDSKDIKDKAGVKDLIDEYKDKYQTHRSFQNELQVHVTFKTKEERGEFPPEPPKEKTEPFTGEPISAKEGDDPFKEKPRGEVAMSELDQVLYKKANTIRDLLFRLVDPTTPFKKRAEDTTVQNQMNTPIDVAPQTPLPNQPNEAPTSPQEIANQMAKKLVEYIQSKAQAPVDDLYNGIKHWMSEVRKELKGYEQIAGQTLNKAEVSKILKGIVSSGDINKIQEATGILVDQATADLIQKLSLMESGPSSEKKDNEGAAAPATQEGLPSLSETLGKADKTSKANDDDNIQKIFGLINTVSDMDAVPTAIEEIKKLIGTENIEDLEKDLPETFEGKAVGRAILEIKKEILGDDKEDGPMHIVEVRTKEFWEHAKRINKVATIEKTFEEWVNNTKISLADAQCVWSRVKKSVDEMFRDKIAIYINHEIKNRVFHQDFIDKLSNFILEGKDETNFPLEKPQILEFLRGLAEEYKALLITYVAELTDKYSSPEEQDIPTELEESSSARVGNPFDIDILNNMVIDILAPIRSAIRGSSTSTSTLPGAKSEVVSSDARYRLVEQVLKAVKIK